MTMMLEKVLAFFHLTPSKLLGEGGEAQVYALDDARVVRIYREGATLAGALARTELLNEIVAGAHHLPFETPQVLEVGETFGRIYVIEKRIHSTSLLQALSHSTGAVRCGLITQYMDAAWQLGTINIKRPYFGEISRDDAVQTSTLQAYLGERARRSLEGSNFAHINPHALAATLGEPPTEPAFVHLDYYAGNVMADADRLTGVIDFGYSSIIGDRRMNVVAAAAHLMSPRITPVVTEADRQVVLMWLREHDLEAYYQLGERWMAAYWMFVRDDDAQAYAWCCSVLSEDSSAIL